MKRRHLTCIMVLALASAAPQTALAWGNDGHKVVAGIAERRLSDRTWCEVRRILGDETLQEAAVWADSDAARQNSDFDWLDALHYVNVPRDAVTVTLTSGGSPGNVVAAIETYRAVLASPNATKAKKLMALRLLAHFVGDVHQPLHVSYADDRGGNDVRVLFGGSETRLHKLWDTGLIWSRLRTKGAGEDEAPKDWVGLAALLNGSISADAATTWSAETSPLAWANESLTHTRAIYATLPAGTIRDLPETYYASNIPLVEERLQRAGVRLAALLNAAFAPPVEAAAPQLVDVMWWNIRDFSLASRDDAEIAQIAQCVAGMELLVVGELNDPAALERLAEVLGADWSSLSAPKVGRSPSSREHYGFAWKSTAIQLVGGGSPLPDPDDLIDREPAWASFRTIDGKLDFTMLCVHVTWGERVAERQAEIRSLPGMWTATAGLAQGDKDLILVGDFNRNVGDVSFDELLSIPGMVNATANLGAPTVVTGTSTYDQVFLVPSAGHTTEWAGRTHTIAFDEEMFGGDDTAAKLAVSDHRPVWFTLRVPASDDD
jgi:endonuclease/exonuclease/phosphatase family metal-dependent hydrolase